MPEFDACSGIPIEQAAPARSRWSLSVQADRVIENSPFRCEVYSVR